MYHVPMCYICGEKEVQIVTDETGGGFCGKECEEWHNENWNKGDMYPHDLDGFEHPEFDQ